MVKKENPEVYAFGFFFYLLINFENNIKNMIRKNLLHYLGLVLVLAKLVNPEMTNYDWWQIIFMFVIAYVYGIFSLLWENDVAKKIISNEVEKLLIDIVTKREIKKIKKNQKK